MTEKREFREDEFEKIRLIPEAAEEYKKFGWQYKVCG